MQTQFGEGDRVRHISGGPVMTIRGQHYDVMVNRYTNDLFDCIWFARNNDGKEVVQYRPFPPDELIPTRGA